MSSSIFLIGQDNALTELRRTGYESEELLQRLLADFPTVLGISAPAGTRLLLIQREFGVPGDEQGSSRWSLDHLLVDQVGVLILVEVKRASDTRARREVVAQMLDYAANGIAYWPIERVVEAFREDARASGKDPDSTLSEFLGSVQPETFWRQVEANLRAGRVRMVFVADKIPPELRRIVEFLNEQIRPAEVLALEVEQFVGPDRVRTLVPRLVGNTRRAQAGKSVREAPLPVSEDEWIIGFRPDVRDVAARIIAWFRDHQFNVAVSDSQDSMSFSVAKSGGKLAWPFFGVLDTCTRAPSSRPPCGHGMPWYVRAGDRQQARSSHGSASVPANVAASSAATAGLLSSIVAKSRTAMIRSRPSKSS